MHDKDDGKIYTSLFLAFAEIVESWLVRIALVLLFTICLVQLLMR